MPPNHYNLHKICNKIRCGNIPKIETFIEHIRKKGFKGSRTHFDFVSIKTDMDIKTLEDFFEIIRKYELENIRETQLIEEPLFFINNRELFGVKKDVKFAILSLNTRKTINRSLELANIETKIDLIIGREDVRKWKPAPNGLLKIQEKFQVKKEEMVYFGDLKNDILTGKNAGIEAYLIDDLINLVIKKKNKLKMD